MAHAEICPRLEDGELVEEDVACVVPQVKNLPNDIVPQVVPEVLFPKSVIDLRNRRKLGQRAKYDQNNMVTNLITNSKFRSSKTGKRTPQSARDPCLVIVNQHCNSLPIDYFKTPYDHCRFVADALLVDINAVVAEINDTTSVNVKSPAEVARLSLYRSRKRIGLYMKLEIVPIIPLISEHIELSRRVTNLVALSSAGHLFCRHSNVKRIKFMDKKMKKHPGKFKTSLSVC